MNIAVITARGGSKRIPGKNYRYFAGKPMIGWVIETARKTALFDRIIISTDSERIAETALHFGAEVPFARPSELSDDHTPTAPVLIHALKWLEANGSLPEFLCCIYPTAPFITTEDLERGLKMLKESDAPCSISVTTFDFAVLRALKKMPDGSLAFNWPEYELTRSQDLPEFYHDAGQFYWLRTSEFMRQRRLAMPGMLPVLLPRKRVQDLDTPEDWESAEMTAKVIGLGDYE